MHKKVLAGMAVVVSAVVPPTAAQIAAQGAIVTVPVVAQTGTYGSSVFIHNPNGVTVPIDVEDIGADGSATPGLVSCTTINVGANTTVEQSLTQLCPLNAGSNFGRLTFEEGATTNRPFTVYSRVESFSGNGFSVEGFPIGQITGLNGSSWVNGLRRQAAAPGYQSNCFVGALNESVTIDLRLRSSNNTQIGITQTFNLGASQMIRLVDVFQAVGAPAGDYANVRAEFAENGAGQAGFIGFCTVQNNTSFDADFRIAKASNPADLSRRYTAFGRDGFTLSPVLTLTDGRDDVFQVFWQHPDWARCYVDTNTGTRTDFELRVKDPGGTVVAGGANIQDTGEFFLGERSAANAGVNGIWRIEVGHAASSVVPEAYRLYCTTGNGGSEAIRIGTQPDTF